MTITVSITAPADKDIEIFLFDGTAHNVEAGASLTLAVDGSGTFTASEAGTEPTSGSITVVSPGG